MKLDHNATLMRIFVTESARYQRRDLATAIVEALATAGIAGAIVFKGIEGFGAGGFISSSRSADGWVDLPILIEVVDEDDKVRAFLPALEAMAEDALVTLERVQTVLFRSTDTAAR
jgi:PII-like signaling protein